MIPTLLAGTYLSPAYAQTVSPPISAPASGSEQAGPTRIEIPTVIVVARKRKEVAQKTPVSMTVITASDLKAISAQKFSDIQYVTPGLQIEGSSNNQYAGEINIRGQESNQQLLGIDPSVGIYVDGVYETSTLGVNLTDIYGLDQIEVLKGPQGTLYGRNTTGGAINIITQAPQDTPSAQISQSFGSYGNYVTTGYVNVPLVPNLAALRIDGQFATRNGFAKNLSTNQDLGGYQSKSFRGALKITPMDTLTIMIRGDYLTSSADGELFQPISVQPGSLGAKAIAHSAGVPVSDAATAYTAIGGGSTANFNDKNYNFPEFGNYKADGASITVTYVVSSVTIKSISAYRNFEQNNGEDLDASLFNILSAKNSQAEDQYTQELSASGKTLNDRLSYVTGLYYYNTDAKDNSASNALGAITSTLYRNHLTDVSAAAYGQTTYAITPIFHVTGGLRLTTETKGLYTQNSTGNKCNIPVQNLIDGQCAAQFYTTDRNASYSFGLDYSPTQNTFLYFNTSRGFKSGGINERGTATPGSYAIFEPEIATDYELGLKSQWLDNRLQFNSAIYHTDYNDIQRSVTVVTPTGSTASITDNAARATINGTELSATFLPSANALVSATMDYTYPHYSAYSDALGNHTDQMFEGVSRWTYSLSGQYGIPLSFGLLTANVNWYWQSQEDLSPAATGFDYPGNHIQPGYGLLNARLTLDVPRYDMSIAVYGTNLTNTHYFTSILDLATNIPSRSVGTSIGQLGSPLMVGAELTKKF